MVNLVGLLPLIIIHKEMCIYSSDVRYGWGGGSLQKT